MPSVGAPELLIVLLILGLIVVPLVVGVLSLVDIAGRPEAGFQAAGQSRATWLIIAIVSLFVPCVWFADVYYLAAIRPKLARRA